jgi:hypothetical protein
MLNQMVWFQAFLTRNCLIIEQVNLAVSSPWVVCIMYLIIHTDVKAGFCYGCSVIIHEAGDIFVFALDFSNPRKSFVLDSFGR